MSVEFTGLRQTGDAIQNGICLIEGTTVAGTRHVPGIRSLAEGLRAGARLTLRRDASNPHDRYAVRVSDAQGRLLGYVSCEFNEIVSRLIDGGKAVGGVVRSVGQVGSWTKVEMAVVLYD